MSLYSLKSDEKEHIIVSVFIRIPHEAYILCMYVLNRKHIFAQPLLAFNVEVGSKLWTKFIEKVEIHQRRPNSEHILNYNFGRLQQKTEWGLGSLEVTMASKLFLNLFWLNSLDQPQL